VGNAVFGADGTFTRQRVFATAEGVRQRCLVLVVDCPGLMSAVMGIAMLVDGWRPEFVIPEAYFVVDTFHAVVIVRARRPLGVRNEGIG
jgi:hypothetical protein